MTGNHETPVQKAARIARRVKDQSGQIYVLAVIVNGRIADPWVFTEYLDAQAKQAELEIAASDQRMKGVQTQIFRVDICPPAMEPSRPRPATET